jgi:hypothetical protein
MTQTPHFTDYQITDGVTTLPEIDGYTVDMRCREFRRVQWTPQGEPGKIEFVDFESKRGERLLRRLSTVAVPGSRLWTELLCYCVFM